MKKISNLIIILVLFTAYFICFSLNRPQILKYPDFNKGEFFISDKNFYNNVLYLTGDWEFYYLELLDSDGFNNKNPKKYYTLPDYWQSDWNSDLIGINGFGSYRLKITFETKKDLVSINIPWVHGAYELYSNGKSVLKCGTVGTNPQDEIADVRSKSTVIPLNDDKMELIIHISGYLGGKSGLSLPISIGTYSSVNNEIIKNNIKETAFISCLFMMGFFHFVLFIYNKKDKSLLFFSLFCLTAMLSRGTVSKGLLYNILPSNNGFLAYDMYILSKCWLVTFFGIFIYYLLGKKNGTGKINILLMSSLSIINTVCQIVWKYNFSVFLYILSYICFALCIIYLTRVIYMLNKQKNKYRFLYTIGVLFLFFAYGSDILADFGLINTFEFGSTSLVVFIFFESIILAKIFAEYSRENIRLITSMETIVNERTAELLKANENLKLTEKTKNEFISNIFHDLRTPLTVIRGYTELIMSEDEKIESLKEYIKNIQIRTSQIEKLINDLFFHTQLTEKQMNIELIEIDIKEFLKSNYNTYKPITAQNEIELILQDNNIESKIITDKNFLFRIIDNLMQNAIYHTHTKIILESKIENNYIILSVTDDGIGILEEDLPYVFDRLYKKRAEGTGLGLSIVKELALALGGEVFVNSKQNEKTVFGIKLKI